MARKSQLHLTLCLLACAAALAGCVNEPPAGSAPTGSRAKKEGPVRIGLSLDALAQERWQRDRDYFLERAKQLGAEVLVQSANGDDALQSQQAENLLTQGVDVLVVVPHNAEVAASIVESARRQNVPVLSYDRLIRNADVDLYVSFDNVKVGEYQARYLYERMPKGNYVLIGGAPTDNNAQMLRQGQLKVLQPAIDRGEIKIVADQPARDWLPSEALKHAENALTKSKNDVQAVVVSNDGTAGGVVQALDGQKLAGKVLVSGQDAELAALQRIVEGTQTMTVYKPIKPLAYAGAEAAVKLARGEPVAPNTTVNNGQREVPSVLLEPIQVDKNNVMQTVIKDGFHKAEDVYKNVPPSARPKP